MTEQTALPLHLRDPAQLMTYRQALIAKMGQVSNELARLMAGEEGSLAKMKLPGLGARSGDDAPEDRLRAYLELLKGQLRHILDEDGLYGCCRHCAAPLGRTELDEMAWADTCRDCAAKGVE